MAFNISSLFKPATLDTGSGSSSNPVSSNSNPTPDPKNISDPNPNSGANPNDPAKGTENPFDGYAKLFDNANKSSDIQAPKFDLDPKVLAEVSSKMDFTKGINPELVKKAQEGDVASMMQMMQEVGRNAYRASLEHTTRLTDTHLGQRSEFERATVQKGVKQQLTSDALSSTLNVNHPVVKAELQRIAEQFSRTPEFADASPKEIAEAAKKYLDDLNSALNPKDDKGSKGKSKDEGVDYLAYLGGS